MLFCFRIRRKHTHTYWLPVGLVCGFVSASRTNNYLLAGHIGLEMSKEVRLADVRNPRGIFEHSLILVIRLGSVLYQFEQRSVEDWLDLFAANARDLLYTSFNTERCGFVALETGYQCK